MQFLSIVFGYSPEITSNVAGLLKALPSTSGLGINSQTILELLVILDALTNIVSVCSLFDIFR